MQIFNFVTFHSSQNCLYLNAFLRLLPKKSVSFVDSPPRTKFEEDLPEKPVINMIDNLNTRIGKNWRN